MTTAPFPFPNAGSCVIGRLAPAEQVEPKLAQAFLAVADHPWLPQLPMG